MIEHDDGIDPPQDPTEAELLDPEVFETPAWLNRDDCRDHMGAEGRLTPRTDAEQDDDR